MKKTVFISVITLLLASIVMVSCKDDDDSDRFPELNKDTFVLSPSVPDTFYSVNKSDYKLFNIVFMTKADSTWIAAQNLSPEVTTLTTFDGKTLGSVTYRYGELRTIDIPGFCTITKLDYTSGKRCAYKIQPYPNCASYPYYIKIFLMNVAPVKVTIR